MILRHLHCNFLMSEGDLGHLCLGYEIKAVPHLWTGEQQQDFKQRGKKSQHPPVKMTSNCRRNPLYLCRQNM